MSAALTGSASAGTARLNDAIGAATVKFNNKVYNSWGMALDNAKGLVAKGNGNWARTKLEIVNSETKEFALSCCDCNRRIYIGNVSAFWARHNCVAVQRSVGESTASASQASTPNTDLNAARAALQPTRSKFLAPAATQNRVIDLIAKALITSNVPLDFVENRYFRQALRHVGIELPSAKTLSTTILDRLYESASKADREERRDSPLLDAATDGWRKWHCEFAGGMQKFMALLEHGAQLFDVVDASAHRKDAQRIAHLLEDTAKRMTDDNTDRLVGWLTDNCEASWSAMAMLQPRYPKWIMRSCLSHGLALAMKDFTSCKEAAGGGAAAAALGWGARTRAACTKIADFIRDSREAKRILRRASDAVPGAAKELIGVDAPSGSRSADFAVILAVRDARQALVKAVASENWAEAFDLSDPSDPGHQVKAVVEGSASDAEAFWEDVDLLVELLQPFSDAIAGLASRPSPPLSQCHPVLMHLRRHVAAFAREHAGRPALAHRLVETFERRLSARGGDGRAPIYNAAYATAFLLDPYYARMDGPRCSPPRLEPAVIEEAVALVRRVGGAHAERQLRLLVLGGYPEVMTVWVASLIRRREDGDGPETGAAVARDGDAVGSKRRRRDEPGPCPSARSMRARRAVWLHFAPEKLSALADVAARLLTARATAAAPESSWSLWGGAFTASHDAAAQDRARKMITVYDHEARRHARETGGAEGGPSVTVGMVDEAGLDERAVAHACAWIDNASDCDAGSLDDSVCRL